jgi:DNA-binding TFAR19-related protein (PDSD5 family)
MFCTRLLSAVVALAAMVLTAIAQPRGFESPPPGPVVLNVIDHVGDKALADELKLTDEQVKKLTDHRQKEWDAAYTTAPAEFSKTQAERNKAAVALLKEVLTPDQHARATQLMAQVALQDFGGPGFFGRPATAPRLNLVRVPASTLRLYPEIAEAAKLTAEQRKAVEAAAMGGFGGPGGFGGRFGGPFGYTEPRVVLAPDQTEALKKFLGPVAAVGFRMFFDQRPRGDGGGGGPGFGGDDALSTLTRPQVQTELKLTEEQVRVVSALQRTRDKFYYIEDTSDLSPEKAAAREKGVIAEAEKGVAELLNEEQAVRLKQIQFRMRIGTNPDPLAAYAVPEVAGAIGLSDAQKKALTEAAAAHRAEVVKALEADEPLDVFKKRLAAAGEAREAAVEKAVTAEQKAKLKDLLGAEFKDTRFGGGDFAESLKRVRIASFGRYTGELSVLNMRAVRDDLKLSEEQSKKVAEAFNAYEVKFGSGGFPGGRTQEEADKGAAEQHAFVGKALDDILTTEQRKRFRQLVIQYHERVPGSGFGELGVPTPAVGVPGVADEVKLTADQKQKILDGTDPNEVLTGDQKATIKKLAGEPMKGEFTQPFWGGGRPRGSTRLTLLDAGAINPELKLTAEQEYKIALALEVYATRLRELNRVPRGKGATAATAQKAQEEALAACEKAIDAVLTPEQKARLAQFELQATGSLTSSFARADVAAKLALTADQKAKLDAIRSDYRERNQFASEANPVGGPFGRFDAETYQSYQAMLGRMRQKAQGRMLAELTETQKAAWKELVGEPSNAIQSSRALGRGRFGNVSRDIDP